jgi:hypothetical protein
MICNGTTTIYRVTNMGTESKPTRELSDEDIKSMPQSEIVERLAFFNPFGGYSTKDKREVLENTLTSWRDKLAVETKERNEATRNSNSSN